MKKIIKKKKFDHTFEGGEKMKILKSSQERRNEERNRIVKRDIIRI